MRAPRNPHGDAPPVRRLLMRAKSALKRRLAPAGQPVQPPADGYLIVPIIGQSNAFGMGAGLDLDGADRPDPRVHQWAMCGPSAGSAVLAVDPLLHEIPGGGAGFGVTFGKALAEHTGRTVLLIPGARGDTAFTPKNGYTWDKDDVDTRVNLYRDAVGAINSALAAHRGSSVAAFLWHQGESDVPLMTPARYAESLDALIDDLRRRFGADVPFLVGQMVPEEMEADTGKDYPPFDAVHADTPRRRRCTAFVPGERGHVNSPEDRHYDAAGQRAMGRGMWAAYRGLAGAREAGQGGT